MSGRLLFTGFIEEQEEIPVASFEIEVEHVYQMLIKLINFPTPGIGIILIIVQKMMSLSILNVSNTSVQIDILHTFKDICLNMRIYPPEAVN